MGPEPVITAHADAVSPSGAMVSSAMVSTTLEWRHNELDGVWNHQRLDCLLNRLFRRKSKKTSKLRVTGLCDGNPLVTGGFPSQRASDAVGVKVNLCY